MKASLAALALASTITGAQSIDTWGGKPFLARTWTWLDPSFNSLAVRAWKGDGCNASTTDSCAPVNYCNSGPLVNCNFKQGDASLISCIGMDKSWVTKPEHWTTGSCGRDSTGTTCCPAGASTFQAGRDSISVAFGVSGYVNTALTNYKNTLAGKPLINQTAPFPPLCFINDAGGPCPNTTNSYWLPGYQTVSVPQRNANNEPPIVSNTCCYPNAQAQNATTLAATSFIAPTYNLTYTPAVKYTTWMCYAKSSIYQRGWRKGRAPWRGPFQTRNLQCWQIGGGPLPGVAAGLGPSPLIKYNASLNSNLPYDPNAPGAAFSNGAPYGTTPATYNKTNGATVSGAFDPAYYNPSTINETYFLEPTTPQGMYYLRVMLHDATGELVGFGDSNVTQGYFYVWRYDPLEDGKIQTGAAIMSAFAVTLMVGIVLYEQIKNKRADQLRTEVFKE